jgi:hypothetical protein
MAYTARPRKVAASCEGRPLIYSFGAFELDTEVRIAHTGAPLLRLGDCRTIGRHACPWS